MVKRKAAADGTPTRVCDDPLILVYPAFVSAEECATLLRMAKFVDASLGQKES